MAMYFRLGVNGDVKVAMTLTEKELTSEEFEKKGKTVKLEQMLKLLPKSKAEKVLAAAKRLKELQDEKITRLGYGISSNPVSRTSATHYAVGGKVFTEEFGDAAERFEKKDAIKYANEFYGEEFMKNYDLSKIEDYVYLKGDRTTGVVEITKEEYEQNRKEIRDLTSVISLNKLAKKDSGKR